MAVRSPFIPAGKCEDAPHGNRAMTAPIIHLTRLARWGVTLARRRALVGIEDDPNAPAQVRRLVKLARWATLTRKKGERDYGGAFRAIGPAAIKLGQSLATRPDLVGEEAAENLLSLQDSLPPVPFTEIKAAIEASFDRPLETMFAEVDPDPVGAASIAQVHKAVTTDGRTVAIKVLRPGIREKFARDIQTYEWAAAHVEAMGGEATRLRPRLTIANFKRWSNSELDLRREAASASELTEEMSGVGGYRIPAIDWDRTNGRVLTIEWIDGVKISNRDELIARGHDLDAISERLVISFLTQAISAGFFHADMHQGNLFIEDDGTIVAIDFGIMGRIDRRARQWLAEILYGLTTGNYKRVSEIHFEAQYVPSYHSVGEFATALRAVGEPMRGKPVKELSVGQMLDGLFAITRDFDMQTQPHLLLLQKTMVMVEGIATQLNPDINMWDTAAPYVRSWIRDELGPEAAVADRIKEDTETLFRLPGLIRRLEEQFPPKGGAPEAPPLPEIKLLTDRKPRTGGSRLGYVAAILAGAGAMWAASSMGWIG
ncbi:2-polyprenylphenol 6-hydroxylase [Erythrobacter sp. MTPC3]